MPVSRARRAQIAERRARAIALRAEGRTWDQICAELGYSSRAVACKDVSRALEERLKEQADQADHLRAVELERLDTLEREVWTVLRRRHVTVSGGKLVADEDGIPLQDDGPTLAAVDRLVRIAERRARLLGLDSPVKVDQTGTVRYVIDNVDLEALR